MDTGFGQLTGQRPVRIPNPDIQWETQEQLNVGLDLDFFDSRLGLVRTGRCPVSCPKPVSIGLLRGEPHRKPGILELPV